MSNLRHEIQINNHGDLPLNNFIQIVEKYSAIVQKSQCIFIFVGIMVMLYQKSISFATKKIREECPCGLSILDSMYEYRVETRPFS